MPNYRRANTSGATYFFTVVTYQRQKILCQENIRTALRNAISEVRQIHPFNINGWVLLPDHLHCIWTLPPNDADFSIRWAMIKRSVTKQRDPAIQRQLRMTPSRLKRKESTLWQRRFWEHQIRDDHDYQTHLDYLHFNPVKHGLVQNTKDWPYSTFHRQVRQGNYTQNWGGTDVINNFGDFGE